MASRLKAARQERGWSQSRLIAEMEVVAGRQGVTLPSRETLKSRVSRWENNHARPDDFYRQLLREALGLDDRELGYAETAPPDTGATAAEELASRINLATQADDTLLGALKHQTEAVRLQDRQYGAGSLLEQMRGHVENIETHLSHAVFESSRQPLAWHLADSAALTGWQALDLGAIAQAWRYFELAARAAQQAGDLALYAFARLEHARALADLGRPAEAATLAQEVWSRAHDQVMPSARCWMAAAGAEMLAVAADGRNAVSMLGLAESAVDSLEGELPPYLVFNATHLDRWVGHTLEILGDPAAERRLRQRERVHGRFVHPRFGVAQARPGRRPTSPLGARGGTCTGRRGRATREASGIPSPAAPRQPATRRVVTPAGGARPREWRRRGSVGP